MCVPMLAILRILLQRVDHPLAKQLLVIIRDSPKDELLELQRKRQALFGPLKERVAQMGKTESLHPQIFDKHDTCCFTVLRRGERITTSPQRQLP